MDKTTIGDRMKNNYEKRSRSFLTRRTPVIMRLDGRAFHTFTKKYHRPFDSGLHWAMCQTAKALMKEVSEPKVYRNKQFKDDWHQKHRAIYGSLNLYVDNIDQQTFKLLENLLKEKMAEVEEFFNKIKKGKYNG